MSTGPANTAPRVLAMEQSGALSALLESLITAKKIELTSVGSAFDGLEVARESPVDVILLEMRLQDLDGMEVLRRLRRSRRLREIPVIAIETGEAPNQEKDVLDLGAIAYSKPPLAEIDLAGMLMSALEKRPQPDRAAIPDTEQRLRTRDDLLNLSRVVENVSDAVWLMEPNGVVSYVNPSFERIYGQSAADCRAAGGITALFASERLWGDAWKAAHQTGAWSGEAQMTGANGMPVMAHLRVIVVREPVAGALGVVGLATNLTQRKQMEQDLMFLTDRDPLTGLWNRRSFGDLLHNAIADARNGPGSFLLFVDLDHFRVVNSTLGSPAGDRLLKEVARVLRESLRRGDEVGRYGSDEFVVLLRKVEEPQAIEVSRRLLRKLDGVRFIEEGRTFSANASIGLAQIDGTAASEEIFSRAHAACHEVKSRGRNDLRVWHAEDREMQRLAAEAGWSVRIREAIRTNRMEVWLQPILPLTPARSKVYFEVLMRMIGPDGNLILPGEFLPAAERFGNMLQIDEFATREAVALMAEHAQFNLSVNLSARSLKEDELPQRVAKMLDDAKVDPSRVAFEVTETTLINDLVAARKLLLDLRELGCAVFLDDFGAGASSMTYLRDLPVDVLKIDGSFFHTVDADQTSRTLVKTMNELGHALKKQTVAEHVMSASVLRTTRELQIDYAQGWFVCEPARPAEFLEKGISKLTLFAPNAAA